MTRASSGSDFLARRSDVVQGKQDLPQLRNIILVEDDDPDADRLKALLHLVLGRDPEIRIAGSLNKAIDMVLQSPPDLMILDDYLVPNDSALETIPMVLRAGYKGPIVVLSGELDRSRIMELKKAGASGTIHKEDLNSVELGAVLAKVFADAG